jgi:hypothetical protein
VIDDQSDANEPLDESTDDQHSDPMFTPFCVQI